MSLRETTPDRHWAKPGEFFYIGYTPVGGKHDTMPFLESHWLETYPENRFDNFYDARAFAEEAGFPPHIKIYKKMEGGGSMEEPDNRPWDTPGWKHNPKYRYIIQGLQLTNGYGVLRNNPFWQMMGSSNDLNQMIHMVKIYRGSILGSGSICRIVDTKEERIMEEYNDTVENDERRRQKAIQESPINQRRHEEFLARKAADPEGYWKTGNR